MINKTLSLNLPVPWKGEVFTTDQIGPINFLVGPNGSGKSQFAQELVRSMESQNPRLLGTDRLDGMQQFKFQHFMNDPFKTGIAKDHFGYLKDAGRQGSGIDSIVLLEERIDLRIQIEATLSHLFDREITLEWDSGRLIPKVRRRGDNASYRLDREECHGIKELLVLLTHLYDNTNRYLIIDEPELNLHPQYQAFFMQEVRKVIGDPEMGYKKKIVFLITHSPFILDFRSEDDVKSVISFNLDYSAPKQIADLDLDISSRSLSLTQRLNAHHKQLFFSDNPIFVEGILDARLVEAMMEARGVSVAGAGSCIIDVGGHEEVNQYLKLCQGLGKTAHFLYDLDSLFCRNLRACIKGDQAVQSFLESAGLGSNFAKYCGELDKTLNCLIDKLLDACLPEQLNSLGEFLKKLGKGEAWKKENWSRARVAVMTAISLYKEDVISVLEEDVKNIEGRLRKIIEALKEKNIYLLPGGTIERYLPHYTGSEYKLEEGKKREAVLKEIEEMPKLTTEEKLSERYGELYDIVRSFPSKANVDFDTVLRSYLSKYIHELQQMVVNNPNWSREQIQERLKANQPSIANVFSIQKFEHRQGNKFSATIEIAEMLDLKRRITCVSDQTNAGMDDFKIELVQTVNESTP